jgi:hypothetical protein
VVHADKILPLVGNDPVRHYLLVLSVLTQVWPRVWRGGGPYALLCVCVRACVRASVPACVRACVRVLVTRKRARMCMCVS